MTSRRRLDNELVRRGLAPSRAVAARLIDDGAVTVGGAPAAKAARLVAAHEPVTVAGPTRPYVSRGGEKLAAALDRFGIDPSGAVAIDVGASTGGFTDCLLQRGVAKVLAVDVGRGQLHDRLRADGRVVARERTDVRSLTPADVRAALGVPVALAVVDVSFISLSRILPTVVAVVGAGSPVVVLVKPQFEAGRREADRGRGVITDPAVWRRVLAEVVSAASACGLGMMGAMVSPLRGAKGNVEFLAWGQAGAATVLSPGDLDAVVAAAAAATDGSGDEGPR